VQIIEYHLTCQQPLVTDYREHQLSIFGTIIVPARQVNLMACQKSNPNYSSQTASLTLGLCLQPPRNSYILVPWSPSN